MEYIDFKIMENMIPEKNALKATIKEDGKTLGTALSTVKGIIGTVGEKFGFGIDDLSNLIPDDLIKNLPKMLKVAEFYDFYKNTVNKDGTIKQMDEVPEEIKKTVARMLENTSREARKKFSDLQEINPILAAMEKYTSELGMYEYNINKDKGTVQIDTVSKTQYTFHSSDDSNFILVEAKYGNGEKDLLVIDDEKFKENWLGAWAFGDDEGNFWKKYTEKSIKEMLSNMHLAQSVPEITVNGVKPAEDKFDKFSVSEYTKYKKYDLRIDTANGAFRFYSGLEGDAVAVFRYGNDFNKAEDEFFIVNDKNLKEMLEKVPVVSKEMGITINGCTAYVPPYSELGKKLGAIVKQSVADMKYSVRLGKGSLSEKIDEISNEILNKNKPNMDATEGIKKTTPPKHAKGNKTNDKDTRGGR